MPAAFELLVAELTFALKPVVDAVEEEPPGSGVKRLALETGYDLNGLLGVDRAIAFASTVSFAHNALRSIVADPEGFLPRIPEALEQVSSLWDEINQLDELVPQDSDLGIRLFDLLVTRYIEQRSPGLYGLFVLTGVVTRTTVDASGTVPEYELRSVNWEQLSRLTAPEEIFRRLYGWGDPNLDSNTLLQRLSDTLWALGLPATYEGSRGEGTDGALDLTWMLESGPVRTFLVFTTEHLRADGGRPPGLEVVPAGLASFRQELDLTDGWQIEIEASAKATSGFRLSLRPGGDLRLGASPGQPAVDWMLGGALSLSRSAPADGRTVLFGSHDASRLEAETVELRAAVEAHKEGGDGGLEFQVQRGLVVVTAGKEDGFLQQVLPPQGIQAPFDFTIGWSNKRGLHFAGAGGLEAVLGLQVNLGPLRVHSIVLALSAGQDGVIEATAGASAAVNLGPLTASIDRVGLKTKMDFQPPFDLDVSFRPPQGVGLSIDAGAVTGGGFLSFNEQEQQYAGAVHLDFQGIALNAIGILTTRMPDGSQGFSLLIIVTASGFTPIQLGFGFTLNGVGGLLGINRTAAIEVLRAGVRQKTLEAVLFSKDDPVPRAPQIVSTLRSVFPPAPDRHLFGPMAIIGWGTPTVLTVELAVLLELPAPVRLIVLGRIRVLLPPPEEKFALVKLNMDVLGVVDFGRREVSIDASLFDSQVVAFTVTGDMALRANWGEQPDFALSVGGFHPRARVPAGFPALRRVAFALSTGDSPRLRAEAYLAVTPNTVQLGARLDFYVEIIGFNLSGLLSFDALVQFAPFQFDLEIAASLALKSGTQTLMGIDVRMRLTGPAPWHVRGQATIQILFFRITVPFEARFGEERAVAPLESVEVWLKLREALKDGRNWGAELPGQGATLAAVRAVDPPAGNILVHPLGELAVRQQIVPLEREISRFAHAPPKDYRRFRIESVRVGAQGQPHESTYEQFALGQFTERSEDEQLREPGFDRMPAGVRVRAVGVDGQPQRPVKSGPELSVTLEYETIVKEPPGDPPAAPLTTTYKPSENRVLQLAETGAAGVAELRRMGRAKYATDGDTAASIAEPEFVVRSRTGLAPPIGVPGTDGSFSSAREALNSFVAENPDERENVQIVRKEEALA